MQKPSNLIYSAHSRYGPRPLRDTDEPRPHGSHRAAIFMPARGATHMATDEPVAALDPWDRQENEPLLWYERFLEYFLPIRRPRVLNQAYTTWRTERDSLRGPTAPPTRNRPAPPEWRHAYGTWNWRSRAEAADLHELREMAREQEADRIAARLQRRRVLQSLGDKVEAALPDIELEKGGKDFSTTLRTVFDQQRAEYGDTPETRVNHSGGIVVATITDEAIADLSPEEAYARAAKLAHIITSMGTADTAYASGDGGLREGVQEGE